MGSDANSERATIARALVRRRWLVLALTVLVLAPLAAGVSRVRFTGDYRVFFSEGNPFLAAFEEHQATYVKDENLLFAVAARDGSVFDRETLAAIAELTEAAWRIPHATRVDSLTNFQPARPGGGGSAVEGLVADPGSLTDAELERLRRRVLAEPQLVHRLVSPEGHVAGVNVLVAFESAEGPGKLIEAVDAARRLAREVEERHPRVEVYLSGAVMLHHAFMEATQKDLATLVPIMYLVILVAIALFLRSLVATLATVVVVLLATLSGMGFAGWAGIALTPVSAVAPTLIMTLAVADCVHVLVTHLQERRRGRRRREAIVEAVRLNAQPVLLTTVTTAIGFLSLNASDAPPIRDLGNVTAVGILVACLASLSTLPALVAVLPAGAVPRPGADRRPLFERLADFVLAHRRRLLVVGGALVVALAAFVPRNELDEQTTRYFDERLPFRRDADFVGANLTGVHQVEYSLASGERGGVADPEYLETLDRFARWWREQPEVVHVDSFSDLMGRLHREARGGDGAGPLPASRALAAGDLERYERSLPPGLDLRHQVSADRSSTRLSVTLGEVSSRQLLELNARGEAWLRRNAPPAMNAGGVGPSVMFAHIAIENIRSMIVGTALALALISLCLVLALRSLKFGLVSLVPNLVPAILGFGLWGLLVGHVGFLLSIVLAMTLGIVVDDTVHFLSKYLRARRELALDAAGAVRHALVTVGPALAATTAVLTAGFLVLSLSTFAQNSDMGRLTAMILVLALVADLLLLPPLVLAVDCGLARERDAAVKMAASRSSAERSSGRSAPKPSRQGESP